mgnify:CR=1 FL=1
MYTDVEGIIRSPNYGGSQVSLYPNNLHIQWYIEVPEDHHILIWFSEPFHIEGEPGRCYDKLTRGSGLEVGLFAYLPGEQVWSYVLNLDKHHVFAFLLIYLKLRFYYALLEMLIRFWLFTQRCGFS